jgi:hypothetical protein
MTNAAWCLTIRGLRSGPADQPGRPTEPAFDKTNMYTLQNGNLVAADPSGSPNHWTSKNGTLGTPAVVSGAVVFVGGSAGKVHAMRQGEFSRIELADDDHTLRVL